MQDFLQKTQENGTAVPIPAAPAPGSLIDRPNFHSEPRSQEIFEGQPLYLESKLTPINDPNLKTEFYLNGNPIQSSER